MNTQFVFPLAVLIGNIILERQQTWDLKDAEGKVEFEYLGEETIATGRVAKIYISKTAIPMRERAKQKFQLIVNKNDRPKILVSRLAVANTKRVNRVMHNNQALLVSEIYVNY